MFFRILTNTRNLRNCSKLINLVKLSRIESRNTSSIYKLINSCSINKLSVHMVTSFNKSNVLVNRFTSDIPDQLVDEVTYERVCDETLESLCEYFEELIEDSTHLNDADVSYGSGVLTINFGKPYGTYVINRQVPNRQIWLSSPTSGPKRYDFNPQKKYWIYKHDNVTLHQLLQEEIGKILKKKVDFSNCAFSLFK